MLVHFYLMTHYIQYFYHYRLIATIIMKEYNDNIIRTKSIALLWKIDMKKYYQLFAYFFTLEDDLIIK